MSDEPEKEQAAEPEKEQAPEPEKEQAPEPDKEQGPEPDKEQAPEPGETGETEPSQPVPETGEPPASENEASTLETGFQLPESGEKEFIPENFDGYDGEQGSEEGDVYGEFEERFEEIGLKDTLEEPYEEGTTVVEFIETDENGEEIVVKKRVPLVSETRKIIKRNLMKSIQVPKVLETGEEVEEEVDVMEDVFFEIITKSVKIVTKNEQEEEEEKIVEVREEVMLTGQPKGTKVILVSVVKENGEVSEEEVIIYDEEEDDEFFKSVTSDKKKKIFEKLGKHLRLARRHRQYDREAKEGEEDLLFEEESLEEEELPIETKKKKTKIIKKVIWKKVPRIKIKDDGWRYFYVECPEEGEEELEEITLPEDYITIEGEELVEEIVDEEVEVEEEEPEEYEKEDDKIKHIFNELQRTLVSYYTEALELKRRNVTLSNKIRHHLGTQDEESSMGKDKDKKKFEEAGLKEEYKERLNTYRMLRNSVVRKSLHYMTKLQRIERERDELRAEAINQASELEAKERLLATKAARHAGRYLLRGETLDGLITKQFDLEKRLSKKRTKCMLQESQVKHLEALQNLQKIYGDREVNFLEFEKAQKEQGELQDAVYFKELNILQTRKTLVSNAQALAHVELKKVAVDNELQDVMKTDEECTQRINRARWELHQTKKLRGRVEAELKQLDSRVGVLKYPKLLWDYKYIRDKYALIQGEVNEAKKNYEEKSQELKQLMERQKKYKRPSMIKPVFKRPF